MTEERDFKKEMKEIWDKAPDDRPDLQQWEMNEIHGALAKAQGAMKAPAFNRTNPHFKSEYADLAAVIDAVRKPLADNGLAVTQTTVLRDGMFLLVTTLRHESGQWISSEYPLPMNATPQQLGSALTYAKRYSLSSICCIAADKDDDAEAVEKRSTKNGSKPALLSEEQIHSLEAALEITNAPVDKFLRWARVESLAEIKAEYYDSCLKAIQNFGGK